MFGVEHVGDCWTKCCCIPLIFQICQGLLQTTEFLWQKLSWNRRLPCHHTSGCRTHPKPPTRSNKNPSISFKAVNLSVDWRKCKTLRKNAPTKKTLFWPGDQIWSLCVLVKRACMMLSGKRGRVMLSSLHWAQSLVTTEAFLGDTHTAQHLFTIYLPRYPCQPSSGNLLHQLWAGADLVGTFLQVFRRRPVDRSSATLLCP